MGEVVAGMDGQNRSAGRIEQNARIGGVVAEVYRKRVVDQTFGPEQEGFTAKGLANFVEAETGKKVWTGDGMTEIEVIRAAAEVYAPFGHLKWADVGDEYALGYARGFLAGRSDGKTGFAAKNDKITGEFA